MKEKTTETLLQSINKVPVALTEAVPNVRWAPIRVPFRRRAQTAAVLFWSCTIALSLSVFFWSMLYPFLWPFHIAYLIYMYLDQSPENGGYRYERMRRLPFWNYFAGYFPVKLVKTHDLDPSKNYICGYHPHGIIGMGAISNFATEATGFSETFPGIIPSLLTLTANFKIPIYRELILSLGIASVSRHSCEKILSSGPGRTIVIVVGGASESLSARPGTNDLTLKKRLGFIRLAIRNQVELVPIFSFGENDLFEQVDNSHGTTLWKIQKKMQEIAGFTMPLFHARGLFNYDIGLMPYRHEIVTVVGKPIAVPKLLEGHTEPTHEQIVAVQESYIAELENIYNEYKDVYAKDRKQELRIVG
ncbi:diacylglycerol acyltransferase type 2B [Pilobolus umbonatus]|nr:diacylglycerol acyltransferase type 2B [Pilobolus umbonatus]